MNPSGIAVPALLGLSLALACPSATTFAQNGGDNFPSGPPPFLKIQMVFSIFDANQDDALAESEVPSFLWNRILIADANEDGSVTKEEFKTMAATRLFGNFDENEDGAMAENEVPAKVWQRLSSADGNEDGQVTFEEFLAVQAPQWWHGNSLSD